MGELVPVLIVAVIFATIGWTIYIIADSYRRKQRLKAMTDLHSRIMDRMGSTNEFIAFLATDGGRKLIDSMALERPHPADRILRAVQTGLIFTAVGIGFLVVRPIVALEVEAGFTVFTALLLSLGLGFLASAVASWGLSRSFGLFDRQPPLSHDPGSFSTPSSLER